jgi:hypothetical protein
MVLAGDQVAARRPALICSGARRTQTETGQRLELPILEKCRTTVPSRWEWTNPMMGANTAAGICEMKVKGAALKVLQTQQKTHTVLRNAQVFQNPRSGETLAGDKCILQGLWAPTLRKTGVRIALENFTRYLTQNNGAERGGFEPPAPVLPVQLLSRQPCSATPAPLRNSGVEENTFIIQISNLDCGFRRLRSRASCVNLEGPPIIRLSIVTRRVNQLKFCQSQSVYSGPSGADLRIKAVHEGGGRGVAHVP